MTNIINKVINYIYNLFFAPKSVPEASLDIAAIQSVKKPTHTIGGRRRTGSGIVFKQYNPTRVSQMMRTKSAQMIQKPMVLTSPEGVDTEVLICISHVCRKYGLTRANLHKVAQGKRKHHKGWKARYVQTQEVSTAN